VPDRNHPPARPAQNRRPLLCPTPARPVRRRGTQGRPRAAYGGPAEPRSAPLLPTTAIKGSARPVTSAISDRPASLPRPARRLHDESCPQRRAPTVNPGRGLVRQVNGGIFSSPPLLDLEASRARKISGHAALPTTIKGGRQSLAAPHPTTEPQQPFLAPPPPPIAPPLLAFATARTAPWSRLPKQPQPKVSTGMGSPRSPLCFAPSPGCRRGQDRRRAPPPAGLPARSAPPASVCSQGRRRRGLFSQKPPVTLLFLPHRAPLLFPLSSFPKYTLNLKFFHQNTPVIFR
jgi:hypothetical protein